MTARAKFEEITGSYLLFVEQEPPPTEWTCSICGDIHASGPSTGDPELQDSKP